MKGFLDEEKFEREKRDTTPLVRIFAALLSEIFNKLEENRNTTERFSDFSPARRTFESKN